MIKNIKTRTLWIIVGILFLLAIGLIVACAYIDESLNKLVIVLLTIDFIVLTILVQYTSLRTFKYKPKLINYPQKNYISDIEIEEILQKKYKKRSRIYGDSYLKIENKVAYKVSLITDIKAYFEPEEEIDEKPNKELEKCTKFVGLEIFVDVTEEAMSKIVEFSIQGENVYYTALIKKENEYLCLNYLEPNEFHKENVEKLYKELQLNVVDEAQ